MILISILLPATAHAVCADPSAPGGKIIFDVDTATVQYCNGAEWVKFPRSCTARRLELNSSVNTPGNARDVVMNAGGQMFVADGANLRAYLFTGSSITSVTSTAVTDTRGVAINDTHVFAGDGTTGVRAFTYNGISFSAAGTVNTPGTATRLFVDGNTVFVADGTGGLRIYTYDGANFTPAGFDSGVYTNDVYYDGTYVFAANSIAGLQAYSYDGSNLVLLDTFDTVNDASGVTSDGNYVYVAKDAAGLSVLTFDGTSFVEVASVDTPVFGDDVGVAGNLVFVTDGSGGLITYRFDGSNLNLVNTIDTTDWAQGLHVLAPYVLVAANTPGVMAFEITCGSRNLACTHDSLTVFGSSASTDYERIAMSDDGQIIATPAEADEIYISTDGGATWGQSDSNRNWTSIGMSADGQNMVAAVNSGNIYTSTDQGANWSPRDANRVWRSVAMSADGQTIIGAVDGANMRLSTNGGASWSDVGGSRAWRDVAMTPNGQIMAAVVSGGQVYRSVNGGANWTAQQSNRTWRGVDLSDDGQVITAVAPGAQIYVSTDGGANWDARDSSRTWWAVKMSADGRRMIASVEGGQIYVSHDTGTTWTPLDSNRDWRGVAITPDGNRMVATVRPGQIYYSACSDIATECNNPNEPAGSIIYNTDDRVVQWCDGSDWHAAGPVDPGGPAGGCNNPNGAGGDMIYNQDYSVVQYCDGGTWRSVGKACELFECGLVHHWKLDESSVTGGEIVEDSVGTINGTITGTLSSVAGQDGNAVMFDANNEYISFGVIPALEGQTEFTLSAWMKRNALNSYLLVGAYHTGTGNGGAYLDFWNDSRAWWGVGNSATGAQFDEGFANLNDTSWHLLTLVYDGTQTGNANRLRAYLNGVPQALTFNGTIPAVSYSGGQPFSIGRWTGGTTYHSRGTVDDVRIYNRALNAVDVRNLYFATGGLCETPGQVCADGSIYAGESPDGGVPMYTTPADTDFTSWNNGTGTYTDSPLVDCVADNEASCDTGEANTNTLVGLADGAEPYEAALHCANLVAHGRSDWYLPARNELMEMRTNRVAIGGFDLSGSFPNGTYWSSSEDTTFNDNDAININFQSGAENMAGNKSNELSVRCVRK